MPDTKIRVGHMELFVFLQYHPIISMMDGTVFILIMEKANNKVIMNKTMTIVRLIY